MVRAILSHHVFDLPSEVSVLHLRIEQRELSSRGSISGRRTSRGRRDELVPKLQTLRHRVCADVPISGLVILTVSLGSHHRKITAGVLQGISFE